MLLECSVELTFDDQCGTFGALFHSTLADFVYVNESKPVRGNGLNY